MRILIAIPSLSPSYGGPIGKARALARALGEEGVVARVVGCGAAEPGETGLPTLLRFHANEVPSRLAPLMHEIAAADVVHVLGYRDPVSALSEAFAIMKGKPLVIEPVGTHRPRLRTFRLKALFDRSVGMIFTRRAALLIATSRSERADLISDGIPETKVRLRPNGLSVEGLVPLPEPSEARARLGLPRDARIIAALGRIIGLKGLTQIPEALSLLPDDVWGFIAGPDERDGTVAEITSRARALGVAQRIVVRPRGMWDEEKRDVLAAASVYCLPSEVESFGVAAGEAAAAGIPVVCSRTCGIVDWLLPGSSSTFDHGDVHGFVGALETMLAPEARAAAKIDSTAISMRLAWPTIAAQQVEIYEEVLAAPR